MKILFVGGHAENSKPIYEYVKANHPQMLVEEEPELIVVAGGDGTMIRAIHQHIDKNVPFFGIGYGTLNFIMNNAEECKNIFDDDFSFSSFPNFGISTTKTLTIDIIKDNGTIISKDVVNEVAIGGTIMGYHTFLVNSEQNVLKDYEIRTEFIAFSTPLGSTAFHYNNNGNVIPDLSIPLIGVSSGVGTRSKKLNMLIEEQEIIIDFKYTRDPCYVFVDGIMEDNNFCIDDKVIIKAGKQFKLAFADEKAFKIKKFQAN